MILLNKHIHGVYKGRLNIYTDMVLPLPSSIFWLAADIGGRAITSPLRYITLLLSSASLLALLFSPASLLSFRKCHCRCHRSSTSQASPTSATSVMANISGASWSTARRTPAKRHQKVYKRCARSSVRSVSPPPSLPLPLYYQGEPQG